ncbi:LamB/YcsF family protein [Actinomadura craniellae]|uniref:5-oxoprolinase subunit A n=1 Tax=Actinomadura craniellae TaxID=2231787 RepID=A0A365GY26_9ACTN|nr:5-oxoprolinase subunit PxpA [Actinomadura craniellae]RAY10833.1 LamB/YcsF family protein [Actinomadura craniellae]
MTVIDLNADLGEGFGVWRLGDDLALLDVVTSANVACGFHAGDPLIMRRVCAAAVERGVAIGAQVSYRDLAGFGRREMDVAPAELTAEVLYQIAALDGIARAEGGRVGYVKPHGALYNRIARDPGQARAVVAAVAAYDPALPVLALPGSAVHAATGPGTEAERVPVVPEGYADRAYTADGTLVSRRSPGAVIHDPGAVARRAVRMAVDGSVTAADGVEVPLEVRSICVHGDTPGAVELARAVRAALLAADVRLRPFTSPGGPA